MRYFFINTDVNTLDYSPHATWIKHDHAFTAGDYEKYGEQGLGALEPGDVLFMYVNDVGVVAAGEVTAPWTGDSCSGKDRLVYRRCKDELIEFRIPVDWFLPTVNNPISIVELKERDDGWTPSRAVHHITNEVFATRLLEEVQKRASRSW